MQTLLTQLHAELAAGMAPLSPSSQIIHFFTTSESIFMHLLTGEEFEDLNGMNANEMRSRLTLFQKVHSFLQEMHTAMGGKDFPASVADEAMHGMLSSYLTIPRRNLRGLIDFARRVIDPSKCDFDFSSHIGDLVHNLGFVPRAQRKAFLPTVQLVQERLVGDLTSGVDYFGALTAVSQNFKWFANPELFATTQKFLRHAFFIEGDLDKFLTEGISFVGYCEPSALQNAADFFEQISPAERVCVRYQSVHILLGLGSQKLEELEEIVFTRMRRGEDVHTAFVEALQ